MSLSCRSQDPKGAQRSISGSLLDGLLVGGRGETMVSPLGTGVGIGFRWLDFFLVMEWTCIFLPQAEVILAMWLILWLLLPCVG